MKPVRIGILDYGLGNLASAQAGLVRAGAKPVIVSSVDEIAKCDSLVIPGVGAFKAAMRKLGPMRFALKSFAKQGKPILGICLGMQVLFEKGNEGGVCKGLGLLNGSVELLSATPKLPHVGWNQVKTSDGKILAGVKDGSDFYFVHSYACWPAEERVIVGHTEYGCEFASVVESGNVFGVQFHPEKSGAAGKIVLENFVELSRKWK